MLSEHDFNFYPKKVYSSADVIAVKTMVMFFSPDIIKPLLTDHELLTMIETFLSNCRMSRRLRTFKYDTLVMRGLFAVAEPSSNSE